MIFVSQILYESLGGERAPSYVSWLSLALIMCGPVSNGFVYGIKSKTIQMTFVHFARKQMYKNEVGLPMRIKDPQRGSQTFFSPWLQSGNCQQVLKIVKHFKVDSGFLLKFIANHGHISNLQNSPDFIIYQSFHFFEENLVSTSNLARLLKLSRA